VGSLRALVQAFFHATGVPLVLNTSLNIHGRPMAETPGDALQCLLNSGLDVLYCGQYRVEKCTVARPERETLRRGRLVPTADFAVTMRYGAHAESGTAQWSISQGARQIPISEAEKDVLVNLTGRNTIPSIASRIHGASVTDVMECVQSLCERQVLRVEDEPVAAVAGEHV
jgi:hypothetical protein